MSNTFEPISNNILVEQEEAKEKSEGGILLPDQAKEAPGRGKVLAVGKDVEEIKKDDIVLYNKYDVMSTDVKEKNWIVISEEKILLRK